MNDESVGTSSPIQEDVKNATTHRRRHDLPSRTTTSSSIPPPPSVTTSDDAAVDKATLAFVRKTLCAHQLQFTTIDTTTSSSLDALLPPLTSSNEVDLQLYAFIAIIIKDCVTPWYARITSDHAFIDEVVHIIAHCTRALEERLRKVDLEALLLDEIPALLNAHINASRTARHAAFASGSPVNARNVYHTLRPHPALSPVPEEGDPASVLEQQQNDATYRALLAQGTLAVLLPTDDLRNSCLRTLVSEIFADLVLGNFLAGRLCENAFTYGMVGKVVEMVQHRTGIERWAYDRTIEPKDRLTRFGLLSERAGGNPGDNTKSISEWFWMIAQYVYIAVSGLWLLITLFRRPLTTEAHTDIDDNASDGINPSEMSGKPSIPYAKEPTLDTSMPHEYNHKPILRLQLWSTLANTIDLPSRMPWLSGMICLAQHFLLHGFWRLGQRDGKLDQVLRHHLITPFPSQPSKHIPGILRTLRTTLCPNNTILQPQVAVAIPMTPINHPLSASAVSTASLTLKTQSTMALTNDERITVEGNREMRRTTAFALLNLLPRSLARIYLLGSPQTSSSHNIGSAFGMASKGSASGTASKGKEEEGDEVDEIDEVEKMIHALEEMVEVVLGDEYMLRHFVYAVLEVVVARVVPEMAVAMTGSLTGRDGRVGEGGGKGKESEVLVQMHGKGVAELLAERGVVE